MATGADSGSGGGKPLAPASVRRIHVVVRRGLQQGVKWGWLSTNPAANATLPRLPPHDIQPPAPAQVATLIGMAAEEEPEFAAFLRLAAATGARRGELCALRWSDVDLEAGTVVVARSIVQGGEGLVEKDTKTHSVRRIALDRGTVVDLGDHLRRSHEPAAQFAVDFGESGYVFSYQPDRSAPWRPDVATARFERLRARAGLPTVRLHDLRHYVATRLIGAGVSVRTVSGRLGHANPATTLCGLLTSYRPLTRKPPRCLATFSMVRWVVTSEARKQSTAAVVPSPKPLAGTSGRPIVERE